MTETVKMMMTLMKTNSLPLRRRKPRMETLLKLVETEAEEGVVDEAEQLVMEAALNVESRATCPGR